MLTPKEKYIALVANQKLRKADAIILLEGDGLNRIPEAIKLYKDGWAPLLVLSGGVTNPPHSIHSREMLATVVAAGVPEKNILIEEKSQHTRDQAVEIARLAKAHNWKTLLMVASHYHQYRAYLTFLKGLIDAGLEREVVLVSAPARDLPWFDEQDPQGKRADLLEGEFDRVPKYYEQGNLVSYEEALDYLAWTESRQ